MFTDQSSGLEKLPEFSAFMTAVLNETDKLSVKSADFTQAPMAELLSFRKKQYLGRGLDYLCGPATEKKEREECIDERSQHFWIEYNSEIVGSMRATPYPFELIGLDEHFRELTDIGFYLLSESHCSYHTYPGSNYIAVDIFTCGREPGNTGAELSKRLGAMTHSSHFIKRGSQAIVRNIPEFSRERYEQLKVA